MTCQPNIRGCYVSLSIDIEWAFTLNTNSVFFCVFLQNIHKHFTCLKKKKLCLGQSDVSQSDVSWWGSLLCHVFFFFLFLHTCFLPGQQGDIFFSVEPKVWAHFVWKLITFNCCVWKTHWFLIWILSRETHQVNKLLAFIMPMQSLKSFLFIHCNISN